MVISANLLQPVLGSAAASPAACRMCLRSTSCAYVCLCLCVQRKRDQSATRSTTACASTHDHNAICSRIATIICASILNYNSCFPSFLDSPSILPNCSFYTFSTSPHLKEFFRIFWQLLRPAGSAESYHPCYPQPTERE